MTSFVYLLILIKILFQLAAHCAQKKQVQATLSKNEFLAFALLVYCAFSVSHYSGAPAARRAAKRSPTTI